MCFSYVCTQALQSGVQKHIFCLLSAGSRGSRVLRRHQFQISQVQLNAKFKEMRLS